MTDYIGQLFQKYKQGGIFIDTNILLLSLKNHNINNYISEITDFTCCNTKYTTNHNKTLYNRKCEV